MSSTLNIAWRVCPNGRVLQKTKLLLNSKLSYGSLDSQRLVIAHFALGGLSLLGALEREMPNRADVIEWVYSLQCPTGGFYGSDVQKYLSQRGLQQAHIASTFSAVHCLLLLGDDLSRVQVEPLLS